MAMANERSDADVQDSSEVAASVLDVVEVPIGRLKISDVREERDDEALAGLVESMRMVGLLSPIIIASEIDEDAGEWFRVVCGRRRVKAARTLGWETIPAILWQLDDVRREMAVLSENLHRLELSSAERDTAYLRYVQLYSSLFPDAEQDAQDRKLANIVRDEEIRQEILDRPVVDTPTDAAAKAFGVKPPTVSKGLRRARAFTSAQRKIIEMAGIPDRQCDILAAEDADTIEQVVKLLATDFSFDAAMRQVLDEQGRPYIRPASGVSAPATASAPAAAATGLSRSSRLEELLKGLPGRRAILDTEAFDGDVELFLALAREIETFKQKIDWAAIEERHGGGPHGLYYRRLRLALNAPHPRSWSACGCQFNPDPAGPTNCPTCRGGGYQIGG